MQQDEILTLLFHHPLLGDATADPTLPSDGNIPNAYVSTGGEGVDAGLKPESLSAVAKGLLAVRDKSLIELLGDPSAMNTDDCMYDSINAFADDLLRVFADAVRGAASTDDDCFPHPMSHSVQFASKEILLWLVNLLGRWGISFDSDAISDALATKIVLPPPPSLPLSLSLSVSLTSTTSSSTTLDHPTHSSSTHPIITLPALLSDYDSNNDEIYLDPFSFSERHAPHTTSPTPPTSPTNFTPQLTHLDTVSSHLYLRGLRVLSALETTLLLLRTSDPEVWTTEQRVSILSAMVDKVKNSTWGRDDSNPYRLYRISYFRYSITDAII